MRVHSVKRPTPPTTNDGPSMPPIALSYPAFIAATHFRIVVTSLTGRKGKLRHSGKQPLPSTKDQHQHKACADLFMIDYSNCR